MIVVVDSAVANIGSVVNMCQKIGAPVSVAAGPEQLESASGILLPGVGSFDRGMQALRESGMLQVLERKVLQERTPLLGLCLGMQLLARSSEEGEEEGLGWIDADVVRFSGGGNLKVPHMGWNTVRSVVSHSLFHGLEADARFYFVHSYHLRLDGGSALLGITNYGGPFPSAVALDNLMGVQFHPEKSHRFGMKLLGNFVRIANAAPGSS